MIYEACYRNDTGLVVAIKPAGSIWSDIELGRALDPHGMAFSVAMVTAEIEYDDLVRVMQRYVFTMDHDAGNSEYRTLDRQNPEDIADIKAAEDLPWQI